MTTRSKESKGTPDLRDTRPALRIAVQFLLDGIRQGAWKPGQRLPTTRRLAQAAGVSVPTMCKALAEIREQEDLRISPRRGIVLGGGSKVEEHTPPSRPVDRVEEISRRLVGDIACGVYGTQPFLPSCKELCETYGVCFATLRKTLDRLVEEQIITRYKKRYAVRLRPQRLTAKNILLVLSRGVYQQVEKWSMLRTFIQPLIHAMEAECGRRGLRLLVKEFAGDPDMLRGLPDILGAGVLLGPHYPPMAQANALVRTLVKSNRPVFLFDSELDDVFGDLPVSGNLHYFGLDSDRRTREIAHFLISRGHRRVCFFTHEPGLWWSDPLLHGIKLAFTDAGLAGAVEVFYGANPKSLPITEGHVAPQGYAADPNLARQARTLGKVIETMRTEFEPSPYRDRVLGDMEELGVGLTGTWSRFVPLFEQALRIKDATAWVAAEDEIAINAMLPFLKQRRVKIPQHLSVMSCKNTPESLSYNLTTHGTNPATGGAAVIDLFLFPERRRPMGGSPHRLKSRGGYIVDRGSVAEVVRKKDRDV